MKIKKSWIAPILIAAIGFGAYLFTGKHDTAVEQIAEKILEETTGIDVDLSP